MTVSCNFFVCLFFNFRGKFRAIAHASLDWYGGVSLYR